MTEQLSKEQAEGMLPNWIFKVGIDYNGKRNYEVNGAFMYLKPEEMNEFRLLIVDALHVAEKFYRSTHPDPEF